MSLSAAQPSPLRNISIAPQGEVDAILDFRQFALYDAYGLPFRDRTKAGQQADFELQLTPNFTPQTTPPASVAVTVLLEQVTFIPLIARIQTLDVDVLPPQDTQAVFLPGNDLEIVAGSSSRTAVVRFSRGQPAVIRVRLSPGSIRAVRRVEATVRVMSSDVTNPSAQDSLRLSVQVPTPEQIQRAVLTSAQITVRAVGGESAGRIDYYPENGTVVPLQVAFRYLNAFGGAADDGLVGDGSSYGLNYHYHQGFYSTPPNIRLTRSLTILGQVAYEEPEDPDAQYVYSFASIAHGETLLARIRDEQGHILHRAAQCGSSAGGSGSASMCRVDVSVSGELVLTDIKSPYFADPAIENFQFLRSFSHSDARANSADHAAAFQLISGRDSDLVLNFIPGIEESFIQSVEVDLVQLQLVGGRKILSTQDQNLAVSSYFEYIYSEYEENPGDGAPLIPYPGTTADGLNRLTNHFFSPGVHAFASEMTIDFPVSRSQQFEINQVRGILNTVTVKADRRVYTPLAGSTINITVTITLDYVGRSISESIETQAVILTAQSPDSEVAVSGELNLLFDDTEIMSTVATLNLSDPDGAIVLLDTEALGSATVVPDRVRVSLVEELGQLYIFAPASTSQEFLGDDFNFSVRIDAISSINAPFDPEGLVLNVVGFNATGGMHALSFSSGTAVVSISASLLRHGENGELSLRVGSDDLEIRHRVRLLAVPIQGPVTLTVVADPTEVTVPTRETTATVDIVVQLDYQGVIGDLQGVTLVSAAPSGAVLSDVQDWTLNFLNGDTLLETSLMVSLGTLDQVTINFDIAGIDFADVLTASFKVALVEELAMLTIFTSSTISQQATGVEFEFPVTVNAVGSVGTAFNPEGIVLTVGPGPNIMPGTGTYALSFVEGMATVMVTAELLQQGIDGELLLSVATADVAASERVTLQALPVLNTVTVSVEYATYTARDRMTAVEVPVTVGLSYVDNIADAEVLTLMVVASAETAQVSAAEELTFADGGSVQTTITVVLGAENEAVTLTLGIAGAGDAAVTPATVIILSDAVDNMGVTGDTDDAGESSRLIIDIFSVDTLTQDSAGRGFQFGVSINAVSGTGSALNPQGLILEVISLSNVSESTYPLTFTGGLSTVQVTAHLLRQGFDGELRLSVTMGDISFVEQINLAARPILTSLEIIPVSRSFSLGSSLEGQINLTIEPAFTTGTAVADPVVLSLVGTRFDGLESTRRLVIDGPSAFVTTLSVAVTGLMSLTRLVVSVEGIIQGETELTDIDLSRATQELILYYDLPLSSVVLTLMEVNQPLRQTDPQVPVFFDVMVNGSNVEGGPEAFGPVVIELSASGAVSEARTEQSSLEVSETGSAVFRVTVMLNGAEGTTVMVSLALPDNILQNRLTVSVIADSEDAQENPLPADVDGDGRVSIRDLVFIMRFLRADSPETLEKELVVNLNMTTPSVTVSSQRSLKHLLGIDSDRIDVNNDGRADIYDLQIITRYLTGLRQPALGNGISVDKIRSILGLGE